MSAKGEARRRARKRKFRRSEEPPKDRGGAPIRAPHIGTMVFKPRNKKTEKWRWNSEEMD